MVVHVVCPPFVEGANEKVLTDQLLLCLNELAVFVHVVNYQPIKPRRTSGPYNDDVWMEHCLASALQLVKAVRDKDTVIFVDFWHPGIDAIWLHIRLNRLDVKLIGWYHGSAGIKDDYVRQFLSADNLASCLSIEAAWCQIYDQIWCTSQYFARSIPAAYQTKVVTIYEPFEPHDYAAYQAVHKDIDVVWSGRFDSDKICFDEICAIHAGCSANGIAIQYLLPTRSDMFNQFVANVGLVQCFIGAADEEYMLTLGRAKVVLGVGLQEGWGYGVLKAAAVGCIPVVANRAVYVELYPDSHRFNFPCEAVAKIIGFLRGSLISEYTVRQYSMLDQLRNNKLLARS